jgi:hypothetical protein
MPIAKSASQLVREAGSVLVGVAIRAAYAKVRRRMEHRLDSLALLLLLPLRGE